LEGAGIPESSPPVANLGSQRPLQLIAHQYHDYAHERAELLKKIRRLNGFEQFLFPKPVSQLSIALKGGPVVILNISEIGCDGLVLMPGFTDKKIMHIPLTDFTIRDAHISLLTNNLWLVWPCPLVDKLTRSKRREFPANEERSSSPKYLQHRSFTF
jgi:hypothetical protein